MNWGRYFMIFILAFPIVLVINQSFYNFTFKGYALAAAFPKVIILTGIISYIIYIVKNADGKPDDSNDVTPPRTQTPGKVREGNPHSPEDRVVHENLSDDEMKLIKDHLEFYEALELGIREPTTDAQKHFVDVIQGLAKPRTKHEQAFLKYIQTRNNT